MPRRDSTTGSHPSSDNVTKPPATSLTKPSAILGTHKNPKLTKDTFAIRN